MYIPWVPKITISIWLSCYNIKKPLLHFENFLENADEALYLAKNSGRNNLKTCEDIQNKESQ
jgi:PleD family two-component response regulator